MSSSGSARLHRILGYVAIALLIGGFGALGAAAGVRVGLVVTIDHVSGQCGTLSGVDCLVIIDEANRYIKNFLILGVVCMFAGGLWLYYLRNYAAVSSSSEPEGDAESSTGGAAEPEPEH